MKEYFAARLVEASEDFIGAFFSFLRDEDLTGTKRSQIKERISKFAEEARFLGLVMTRKSAERLCEATENATSDELGKLFTDVQMRFFDEAEVLKLFYIHQESLKYYNKTDLFGEEFKTNFPTANAEVIEAGNCFAFDRFTACVSHLMRAMEITLRVLFTELGMPARIWSTTKWSKIADRIKGKIEKNNASRGNDPQWKKDRPFYESTHAFLAAVRVPIRNATMHVESTYDEAGAENVFGAVKSFMRHIATRLKETS